MERKTTHLYVTLRSNKKRYSSLPYNLKATKKCIIASLSNIQLENILTFLSLTDLIRLHQAMLKNPKTEQGAKTIIKFIATDERIYSTIEMKQFIQYYILRKRKLYKWWNSNKQQERNDLQRISWDVQRTNVWFCRSNQQIQNMRGFLTRVLNRLCGSSSQFGYVQGFHSIVKAMFQARLNENQSWLLGSYFLKQMKLGCYYQNKQEKIREICYALDVYVFNNLPQIHYFLKKRQMTADCYAIGWYLTLFSQGLPNSLLNKLWILFIVKGWKVIIKFSVALLCVFQQEIFEKEEGELPQFLSNLHRKLVFKKQKMLWQLYSSIKVTNRMITYLAKNMRQLEYDREISILELKEMREGNPTKQRLSTIQSTSFPSYFSMGVCCQKVEPSNSFPYCNDY